MDFHKTARSWTATRAVGAFLAAAALVPAVADARIIRPADSVVSAGGETVTLQDVYGRGDVIDIAITNNTSCKLYDGANRAVATVYPKLSGSNYYASYAIKSTDAPGAWEMVCGGESSEFVVDDVHEALWLQPAGFEKVVDDYLAAGGPRSDYVWGSAPAVGAASQTWVHGNGWYYVMYTALPALSSNFATKIPNPKGVVSKYATSEPYETLYYASGQAYSNTLQRLALAAKTMAVYMDDPSTPYDSAESVQAAYHDGLEYWGDYLVSIPDWSAPVLTDTYKDGAGRLVYCGTGTCYAKDGMGNKISPSGSLSKVTGRSDDLNWGFMIIGLAAAYDWMHDELDPATRRAWRDKLVAESARYRKTYGLPHSWATVPMNRRANIVANGHTWMQYSAPAIAALVLHDEMDASASVRDRWVGDADDMYKIAWSALRWDGADHQGIGYWEYALEIGLRYADAVRSTTGDDSYYDQMWLMNGPRWLMYNTHPNGQRVIFGDSEYSDRSTVGFLSARLASQYRWSLAQRVAWEGHNEWTNKDGTTRRDVLDILWWDTTVAPVKDANQIARNRCFANKGAVSVRTGWDADAAHVAYRGGGIVGTHDDPDIGSFVLYKKGHLVTSDGMNNVAKRTGAASTLLVDGKGQHGDGLDMLAYAPEGSPTNNARLTSYLDNSWADGSLNVATWATDLTQLYRYDRSDTPYDNATNVEVGKRLYDLRRHMVWLGDAVLVLDRWNGSANFKVDWNLATSKVQDVNRDGREDSILPDTCPVQNGTRGGYYLYKDGYGKSYDVAMGRDQLTVCPSGGSCATSRDFSKLNLNTIAPVKDASFTKYSCEDHVRFTSITGLVTVSAADTLGGKLDVVPLDASPSRWEKRATAALDGGEIGGYTLNRRADAKSGTFLTAMYPYDSGSSPKASATSYAAAGGTQIQVAMGANDATVLFANPANSRVSSSGMSMRGDLAVVVESAADVLKVAQMLNGMELTLRGRRLLYASAPVTAGLTYEAGGVSGYVSPSRTIDLTVDLPHMSSSSITTVTLDGKPISWSRSGSGIKARIDHAGVLRIETSPGRAQGPLSVCS